MIDLAPKDQILSENFIFLYKLTPVKRGRRSKIVSNDVQKFF
jgi:hypothetical protein